MNSFIWNICEYIFCLFEISLFTSFLSNMFKKKYKDRLPIYIFAPFILTLGIYLLSIFNYSFIIHMGISLILLGCFAIALYQGRIMRNIIYVFIFYILLGLIDIVVGNILAVLLKINLGDILVNVKWFRILLFSISKLILFIVLKSIIYFKGNSKLNIPLNNWYMLMGSFVISIVILVIIGEIGVTTLYSEGKEKYLITASIGILSINIFIYYIIIELSRYYEKDKVYFMIESKNELLNQYYCEQEEHYDEIRKLKHDFNNHIICISSLSRDKNLHDLNNYLDDINKYMNNKPSYLKSGNNIIDAILNNKIGMAHKNVIDIKTTVHLSEEIKISQMHLCSILTNLLDNAIEACIRIELITERRIEIRISQFKQYLSISITNSTLINPIEKSFEFITNKNDKKRHGIGMKIIKNIVEIYNGCISYDYKDNMFTIKVLLKNI